MSGSDKQCMEAGLAMKTKSMEKEKVKMMKKKKMRR